jgi:hypothetical protein
MVAPYRATTPDERDILERAYRHYFFLPADRGERLACTVEASAHFIAWEPRWTVRRVRIWFNNNRGRFGAPGAGASPPVSLPPERVMQEGHGAIGDWLQGLHDHLNAHEVGAEQRHLAMLSRLEPSPEGQLVRTAPLVGRSSLPLRVVADLSFRAFMRESAIPPSPSSGTPS